MKNSIKLGQGLAWMALFAFFASLFLPVESNSLPGPCAWPCTQPFVDYGWQNAVFFFLDLIAFPLKLLEVIYFATFDPLTLRGAMESTLILGIYAIIGLGQILIMLAPFWPARIQTTGWKRLYQGTILLSTLAVLAYGLFPDLRLGLDILSGYFLWALSFVLLSAASSMTQDKKSTELNLQEEQFILDHPKN